VEPIEDEMNFKLKKHVALTATLTKLLGSTTKEVEFWKGMYEEVMKTIWKTKHHCPQDWETRSDEETKEFSLPSLPRKMGTRSPPTYVILNDVEGLE
jgi:hypothetical protein